MWAFPPTNACKLLVRVAHVHDQTRFHIGQTLEAALLSSMPEVKSSSTDHPFCIEEHKQLLILKDSYLSYEVEVGALLGGIEHH